MHFTLDELMVYVDFSITIPIMTSLNATDFLLQLHRNSGILGQILIHSAKQKYARCTYKNKPLKLAMFLGSYLVVLNMRINSFNNK